MIFGSVCSGIEGASVAWEPLGWRAAWVAEIEAFPSAVIEARWPGMPNVGDFTRIARPGGVDVQAVDLLVGGTPCQSFSVAGLRGGLADERGNLALEFLRLADRLRPRWLVWENVPGVLSSLSHVAPDPCPPAHPVDLELDGAEVRPETSTAEKSYTPFSASWPDFQSSGMGGPSGFLTLSISEFPSDVAVSSLSDILERGPLPRRFYLSPKSMRGDPPPRRQTGKGSPGGAPGGAGVGEGQLVLAFGGNNTRGPIDVATARTAHTGAHGRQDFASETFLVEGPVHTLRSEGSDGGGYGVGGGTPIIPEIAGTLGAGQADGGAMTVRRLTPRECERLQGFPDDYTAIPWNGAPAEECPDGHRYKAVGNSFAVPVLRWIGRRIQVVHDALTSREEASA